MKLLGKCKKVGGGGVPDPVRVDVNEELKLL